MFVEFNELEVFLVEKTTEADEGREEKSQFTFLIKAVLKANEIKQLIMTYLLTPIFPKVFVRETSGRIQALSLL